jgi:uncharacterized membrane protein YjfL (UPF0719 family)
MLQQILLDYAITIGWAIIGSLSMGLGIILTLKLFDWSTRDVDEWDLIKQGNIPVAIILASVVIACGVVISAAINPAGRGQVIQAHTTETVLPDSSPFGKE